MIVSLWGIFVSNITLTVLLIALPSIAKDLNAELALCNWVSFMPMLAVAAITPLSGRAADRYGAKRMWLLGFSLALLGFLFSALAPSLFWLVLARLVTGIGSALFVPSALAIMTSLYPPSLRATPMGYWTSAVSISPLMGVVVGGYLTELMGWRMLFVAQLLLGLPPLFAGFRLPVQETTVQTGSFDVQGSVAAALAAGGLLSGTTWVGTESLRSPRVIVAFTLAAFGVVWLWFAERRATQPVLPPSLLGQRTVQLALCARVAFSFTYMGAFMTLPYLLTSLWKLSASAVSLALLWRPLAMGLVGPLAGRLSLRFGPEGMVVAGAWLILLSTAAFVGLGAVPNYAVLTFGLVVAGVGLGIGSPGTVAAVSARVGPDLLGTVSALMTLTATLSNALGMAGLFAVVEATGGVHEPRAYRISALVGTAVAVLGVVAAYGLRRSARALALAPGVRSSVPPHEAPLDVHERG
ncbi:MAG: MFS transporter [Polyangiales bacterium]